MLLLSVSARISCSAVNDHVKSPPKRSTFGIVFQEAFSSRVAAAAPFVLPARAFHSPLSWHLVSATLPSGSSFPPPAGMLSSGH